MNSFPEQLSGLDESIEDVLKDWKVPGAAVAIVKGEETVYFKGFGVRDLKSNLTVDAHTLYRLASNTKSFVSLSLGILVDEGKLEWDKPIKNYNQILNCMMIFQQNVLLLETYYVTEQEFRLMIGLLIIVV
jgi:CubicO group peptidase (beta-lactamase class C family)